MTGTTLHIPTLTTERLTLRAPRAEDAAAYGAFLESPRSAGVGGPYKATDAFDRMCGTVGHWHLRGYGRWMIADRETDAALGICGPYFPETWPAPELAWSVFGGAEGRGIAREAVIVARRWAYETLGWDRPISLIIDGNTRSFALAERLGCQQDGTYDSPYYGAMQVWRHPARAEVLA
ncbi:GNAT family N-acetyltransferase [Dinoroseobacter sp. S124A]|uniref:GNAT family N-acetyltransferase n=1 Tax=Dinoroseobacter sp. S124A TaxID=3415128 RepID=UPI003C7A9333